MPRISITVDGATFDRIVKGAGQKGQTISHYASDVVRRLMQPVAEIMADAKDAGEFGDERLEGHGRKV